MTGGEAISPVLDIGLFGDISKGSWQTTLSMSAGSEEVDFGWRLISDEPVLPWLVHLTSLLKETLPKSLSPEDTCFISSGDKK